MPPATHIRGSDLEAGCPVVACDGKPLGRIKDISGSYFKVDAPMARDYWLSYDSVLAVEPGEVRTSFTKDVLGEYRLKRPGVETAVEAPYQEASADSLISDDEMAEQRARMERELAQQRGRLDD